MPNYLLVLTSAQWASWQHKTVECVIILNIALMSYGGPISDFLCFVKKMAIWIIKWAVKKTAS